MKELNNLFSKACLASELGKKGITVDVRMLSQVRDEFWELQKRAEAAEARWFQWKDECIKAHGALTQAEAKLAELERQEPVGFYRQGKDKGFYLSTINTPRPGCVPLFRRPAPAINLAELVPPEEEGWQTDEFKSGRNSMRSDILRNIEEKSK